jgi:hypothetical protein
VASSDFYPGLDDLLVGLLRKAHAAGRAWLSMDELRDQIPEDVLAGELGMALRFLREDRRLITEARGRPYCYVLRDGVAGRRDRLSALAV